MKQDTRATADTYHTLLNATMGSISIDHEGMALLQRRKRNREEMKKGLRGWPFAMSFQI